MFTSKPYRLIPLSRLILARLYIQHVNDDPRDRYTPEDIAKLFSVPISLNLIRSALERMCRDTRYSKQLVVKRVAKKDIKQGYAIGADGIEFIENALLKKDTDIAYYIENGDSAIDDIAGLNARFFTNEDRFTTDEWVPLEIDRGSQEYIEAVEALEEAIVTIRQDNGFAANYPAEREGILSSLTGR